MNVFFKKMNEITLQAAIKASVLTGSDEGVGGGCGRGDFRGPLCGANGDGVDLHTKYSVLLVRQMNIHQFP